MLDARVRIKLTREANGEGGISAHCFYICLHISDRGRATPKRELENQLKIQGLSSLSCSRLTVMMMPVSSVRDTIQLYLVCLA